MIYKTHIATSLSIGFIPYTVGLIELNDPIQFIILVLVGFIFSLMPDLDEPNSYLSRRTPIIPTILSMITTHRAVTHQFIAVLFISSILLLINYTYYDIRIFIPMAILAYFGHIIGDSCTIGGIRRFMYPLSKKTFWILPKFLRFRTGSFIELYFVFPLMFLTLLFQTYLILTNNLSIPITF